MYASLPKPLKVTQLVKFYNYENCEIIRLYLSSIKLTKEKSPIAMGTKIRQLLGCIRLPLPGLAVLLLRTHE